MSRLFPASVCQYMNIISNKFKTQWNMHLQPKRETRRKNPRKGLMQLRKKRTRRGAADDNGDQPQPDQDANDRIHLIEPNTNTNINGTSSLSSSPCTHSDTTINDWTFDNATVSSGIGAGS